MPTFPPLSAEWPPTGLVSLEQYQTQTVILIIQLEIHHDTTVELSGSFKHGVCSGCVLVEVIALLKIKTTFLLGGLVFGWKQLPAVAGNKVNEEEHKH